MNNTFFLLPHPQSFQEYYSPVHDELEKVTQMAGHFPAQQVSLSTVNQGRLEDIVRRWKTLQMAIDERARLLNEALRDFGPQSQHFLRGKFEWHLRKYTNCPNKTCIWTFNINSFQTTSNLLWKNIFKRQFEGQQWMITGGSYVHKAMVTFLGGIPKKLLLFFCTFFKILFQTKQFTRLLEFIKFCKQNPLKIFSLFTKTIL